MRDFNFFEPYQQKVSLDLNIKSPTFLTLVALILIAGYSLFVLVETKNLEARLDKASQELALAEGSEDYTNISQLSQVLKALEDYDQNANAALERINQGYIIDTDFLKILADSMPENTRIEETKITRTYTNFRILAPNLNAIAELLDGWDRSGLFVHTYLSSVDRDGEAGYRAEISTIMKVGD